MRRTFALAMDGEVAQLADGQAEHRGQVILGQPEGQAITGELLLVRQKIADLAVARAESGGEEALDSWPPCVSHAGRRGDVMAEMRFRGEAPRND